MEDYCNSNIQSPQNNADGDSVSIKLSFGNEFRRFTIAKPSFALLSEEIRRLLNIKNDFEITYKDDEGDYIRFATDFELNHALSITKNPLRIQVKEILENKANEPARLSGSDSEDSNELKNMFADRLNRWDQIKQERWERKMQFRQAKAQYLNEKDAARLSWRQKFRAAREAAGLDSDSCEKPRWHRKFWKHNHCHHKPSSLPETGSEAAPPVAFPPVERDWNARFIKHVTVEDNTVFTPATPFNKTWRFRNEGTKEWPADTQFLRVSKLENPFNAPDVVLLGVTVPPGQEVDVVVNMVSPTQSGQYSIFFRLAAPNGKKFGQRVRCQVRVASDNLSSESSDSGDCAEENSTGPVEEWKVLLTQLAEMGFSNEDRNRRLLRRFNGNIAKVVNKLIRRQMKESGLAQPHYFN